MSGAGRAGRPVRVLFVSATLGGGGAERVLSRLIPRLDRARIEPHLALIRREGVYLERLPPDLPVHTVGGGRLPSALWPLWRLMRRLRPDVAIANLTHVNIVLSLVVALLPRRPRLILWESSLPSLNLGRLDWPWLMKLLYPSAYRRAETVVCQGTWDRDDVVRHGADPARVRILRNPLEVEAIRAAAAAAPPPWEGPGRHLVGCGRFSPEKGFDRMLDAFAQIRRARPDVTLHLLGTGPEEAALRRQAEALGITDAVRFAGFVEPYGHLARADLTLFTSRQDAFPNVLLESLACGTPIAGFACPGGVREIVREGVNGWLVPDGDCAALAEAVLRVLDGPLPDPEAVRATVAAFDVETVVPAFERLLAGEPPAARQPPAVGETA